jgi:glutamine synthetase
MSLFLNPVRGSYLRLGRDKAPAWVSWSEENRSQLIRVPAACGEYRRVELRSPDAAANPYLAFALIIYAAVSGMEQGLALAPASDLNAFSEAGGMPEGTAKLPASIEEAAALARGSGFIREHIPETVIESYCGRKA